jgi:hypothetical protein
VSARCRAAPTSRSTRSSGHDDAASATPIERCDEQQAITEMVRRFTDEQILPAAGYLDYEDELR